MENLDLLEDRVRRIAELVRSLRHDNEELRDRLREAEARLKSSAEATATWQEERKRSEEVARQLRLLQEERQEIRGRVSKMLETFSSIDEMQPTGHPDN